MAPVEQIKAKRAGTGLRAYNRNRAFPGAYLVCAAIRRREGLPHRPVGEVVWEFVNPYFGEGLIGPNNRVFRAYRYSKEEIAEAKARIE